MSIRVHSDPHKNLVQMITTSRSDLVAISQILARAIDPQSLFDKLHPLSISINGSFQSGKSLIPLEMRETLFKNAERPSMKGHIGHDEFHEATLHGRPVQINVIDISMGGNYGHDALSFLEWPSQVPKEVIEDTFKTIRTEGGINFFQNKSHHNDVGMTIWVETYNQPYSNNGESSRAKSSRLYKDFKEACTQTPFHMLHNWNRYIEIKSLSPAFNQAVKNLETLAEAQATQKRSSGILSFFKKKFGG